MKFKVHFHYRDDELGQTVHWDYLLINVPDDVEKPMHRALQQADAGLQAVSEVMGWEEYVVHSCQASFNEHRLGEIQTLVTDFVLHFAGRGSL